MINFLILSNRIKEQALLILSIKISLKKVGLGKIRNSKFSRYLIDSTLNRIRILIYLFNLICSKSNSSNSSHNRIRNNIKVITLA